MEIVSKRESWIFYNMREIGKEGTKLKVTLFRIKDYNFAF